MALNVAHRGNPHDAPESTLAAFAGALEIGVDMIEYDVHRLADGALVVMHDSTVDRCTDGSGELEAMTLDQVRALDAGSWFDEKFAGERVPTFEETLAAIPPPTWMNIHLKTVRDEDDAFEMSVLERIHEAGAADRALIVHHHQPSLDRLREVAPELEYCLLPMCADGIEYIERAHAEGFRVLQPGRGMMSPEFCAAVHERGMTANVFYADTREDMQQYLDWGIDGILTNHPRLLKEVLDERRNSRE
ncbi:MAG: hypothetical protein J7M38_11585 [Armatimonadetes bacterium]|nr:hypothetical protein [Armatimonadota bacterium]